jgi:hypothetical protein
MIIAFLLTELWLWSGSRCNASSVSLDSLWKVNCGTIGVWNILPTGRWTIFSQDTAISIGSCLKMEGEEETYVSQSTPRIVRCLGMDIRRESCLTSCWENQRPTPQRTFG